MYGTEILTTIRRSNTITMSDSLVDDLVTANRILANEGIIHGFGHVSVRRPESNEMLISRSRSPAFVTEDDILRMNLNGDPLDNRDARLYKETVIHHAIYRVRPDVNAVVHHHAPSVMPFTITDIEPRPVFHMAALFADGVPTFDDYDLECGRLVVTESEGNRMADVLGDHRAQLLAGHGANVIGTDLKEAIIATVYFVMNVRYQYRAEQLGSPSYYTGPPESVKAIVEDVILAPIAIDRMWEFLIRSLPDR